MEGQPANPTQKQGRGNVSDVGTSALSYVRSNSNLVELSTRFVAVDGSQSAASEAAMASTVKLWNLAVSKPTTSRASVSTITRCGESRNLAKL